ncbi:hypothetical protein O0466_000438 [Salmonella enterica]|nr:hypothetical protein [Salmonella enterica]HCM1893425.1 hypothetical protein [Salmonella enterica subsp. diarizonae serovar 57:c:e,n,x,z15]EAX3524708.1 hypothetical protein [Salmonella enterica]EAY1317962.1 hypothetical protein [Salmonella enterica]EGQ5164897.1 hypothetical protein [Salmonella enterica]
MHKPEALKFNERVECSCHRLPFVRVIKSRGVDFWSVPASGGFSGGCQTGEALARLYLKNLRDGGYVGGGALQFIAKEMLRKMEVARGISKDAEESISGQLIGFFSVLDRWLNIAALSDIRSLDSLDESALLLTANAGIAATRQE